VIIISIIGLFGGLHWKGEETYMLVRYI